MLCCPGSELAIAVEGAEKSGKNVRVVSMPSWELFEEQDDAYKQSVLPKEVEARVSIEVRLEPLPSAAHRPSQHSA